MVENGDTLVCEFRKNIKTEASTQCFVFTKDGTLLSPTFEERSRTKAHGHDYYDIDQDQIIYVVEYQRSNSSRQYLKISVRTIEKKDGKTFERFVKIASQAFPRFITEFLDSQFPEWPYFIEN